MIDCRVFVWFPRPTPRPGTGFPGLEAEENPENQPGRRLVSPKKP